tara:strand:- start:7949 stop:8926 length:978 start_codon:yes stop_codon:yes gene_type:complete
MKLTRKELVLLIESEYEREYFGDDIGELIDDPYSIEPFENELTHDYLEYKGSKKDHIAADAYDEIKLSVRAFGDKLKPYGVGSFRSLFEVPGHPDLLLKVANELYNTSYDPIDMNRKEVQKFNVYSEFFPKVYMHHPEYHWYIVEKVRVLHDYEEMIDLFSKHFKFARRSYFKKFLIVPLKDLKLREAIKIAKSDLLIDNLIDNLTTSIFKKMEKVNTKSMLTNALRDSIKKVILYAFSSIAKQLNRLGKSQEATKLKLVAMLMSKKGSMIDKHIDEMYYKMTSDRKFRKFLELIVDERLSSSDFRPSNMGTDDSGRIIIIDAFI